MILLLFFITLVIGLLAQWHVTRTCASYSRRMPVQSGYTGAEAAHAILHQAGISNIIIVGHEVLLGDHYDTRHRRLALSLANYHGRSASALGVAAHECVHAIQHQQACAPLQ